MNVDRFKTYLAAAGAEILDPTNPYEAVRFRTMNGVSVVYLNKKCGFTFTHEAAEAYAAMEKKSVWRISSRAQKEKRRIMKEVLKRDGDGCFYCGQQTTEENRTLEHILSVSHGGNNNASNIAISCEQCNVAVGNMPVVQKIKYRDEVRKLLTLENQ